MTHNKILLLIGINILLISCLKTNELRIEYHENALNPVLNSLSPNIAILTHFDLESLTALSDKNKILFRKTNILNINRNDIKSDNKVFVLGEYASGYKKIIGHKIDKNH